MNRLRGLAGRVVFQNLAGLVAHPGKHGAWSVERRARSRKPEDRGRKTDLQFPRSHQRGYDHGPAQSPASRSARS